MDTNDLVLAPTDVPSGFSLKESSRDPGAAMRMYGKGRFLSFGDAIWSEATLFDDDAAAGKSFAGLLQFHNQSPGYENIQLRPVGYGDESHVHTGTMRGRPGLWAAVRVGPVVHRFNTYGVDETESTRLLKVQLGKSAAGIAGAPVSPSSADENAWRSLSVDEQHRVAGLFHAVGRIAVTADGQVDQAEVRAQSEFLLKVPVVSKSEVVKGGAVLAITDMAGVRAQIDSFPDDFEYLRACEPLVRRLPEPDRFRLCNALAFLAMQISNASGPAAGPKMSDIEQKAIAVIVTILGMDIGQLLEWIDRHGA